MESEPRWEGGPDPASAFEIIEIGAVKLDQNRKRAGKFHRLVKPQVYDELHFKIQEVTGLDIEQLRREGESFPR